MTEVSIAEYASEYAARIERDPSIAARAGVDPSVVEVVRIALDA